MRTYRRLWLCWWSAIGAVGLLLGFGALPVLTVVGLSLAVGVAFGAVGVVLMAVDDDTQSTMALGRHALHRGLLGALLAVTIVATSSTAGPLFWPLLALVAVSSPWTLESGLRLVRGAAAAKDSQGTVRPPTSSVLQASDWASWVRALSDEQLCTSWCASYTAMQAAPHDARAELVTLRQAYLEDLERRNPAGLRAWLDSGARVSGDPARYLAADYPGHGD